MRQNAELNAEFNTVKSEKKTNFVWGEEVVEVERKKMSKYCLIFNMV